MSLRSHLTRRGSRYYFRQRVPTDLVGRLGCKEIRKSLLSSSPREAVRLLVLVEGAYDSFFEGVRLMEEDEKKPELYEIIQEGVEEIISKHRSRRLATLALSGYVQGYGEGVKLRLEKQFNGKIEKAKEEQKEANTKIILEALANRTSSPSTQNAMPAPHASRFIETFIAEKGGQWDDSAHRHNINYINLFLKIVGDKPLNAFTRQDVLKYVRTLECVHRNYGKSSKDAGLDVDEVLRFSEDKETMNITTLTKHFRCVKSLFTAANHHLDSEVNVEKLFGGIRFRDDVPKAKERKPWTIDDLNRLFATPIWKGTKAQKPSLRYQKGRRVIKDAYWWLPVIAIFTGMRLEEIAQLQCGDLKHTKDGIAYIEVAEGEGKRLKTDSSTRAVPVHPTLADLGFTALFQGGNAEERIFPDLSAGGPQGKFGYQYSQDFTVYRRQSGLYEDLRDFHSFRHTFATHLKRAIKDILMVGEIVGHETQQIETQTYTHPSVADRYEAICNLDYVAEGLDIGHLLP